MAEGPTSNWNASYYDYAGLIIPGSWFFISLLIASSNDIAGIKNAISSFGLSELPLFVVMALVVGHCIHIIGEKLFNKIWMVLFGGLPSSWITLPYPGKVSKIDLIKEILTRHLKILPKSIAEGINYSQTADGEFRKWNYLTRLFLNPVVTNGERDELIEHFGLSSNPNKMEGEWHKSFKKIKNSLTGTDYERKLEVFLGNYAMVRGISIASVLSIIVLWCSFSTGSAWFVVSILIVAMLCFLSAHNYNFLYAQTMLSSYLNLINTKSDLGKAKSDPK